MILSRTVLLAAFFAMMTAACDISQKEDRFTAEREEFAALTGWSQEDHAAALAVFLNSCEVLARNPKPLTEKSKLALGSKDWQVLCALGQQAVEDGTRAKIFFEQNFVPYQIGNNDNPEGLFTGYYEPLLYGALEKQGAFIYPVYGKPKDLIGDTPYLTRQQIDTGGLDGRAPVLVWVNDPVMLFFMQVQGSGRIRLTSGEDMRLGFAARNNQPYASIGRVLREEKLVAEDQLDFFGIRKWLHENPDKARAIMWRNPSYIFFQKQEGASPKGALGVELTAGRSLAVDKRHIPYGLPLYLQTVLPAGENQEPEIFNRLMVAQDTGSAILGPVRGDIFFGYGPEAEYYAGMMKSPGRYTLLVPKSIEMQLHP